MKTAPILRSVLAAAAIFALLVGMSPAVQQAKGAGVITLNGAGATFPYPIYSRWFSEYNRAHPDIRINYQSIGSGGGIEQVKNRTVDFGASDAPLSDELLKAMGRP